MQAGVPCVRNCGFRSQLTRAPDSLVGSACITACRLWRCDSRQDGVYRTPSPPCLPDHPTIPPSAVYPAYHAGIRVIRSVPPHVVGRLPDRGSFGPIAPHVAAGGDRKVGALVLIDENQADICSAAISCSLAPRRSVTNQIRPAARSGRASSGRARNPVARRVVSISGHNSLDRRSASTIRSSGSTTLPNFCDAIPASATDGTSVLVLWRLAASLSTIARGRALRYPCGRSGARTPHVALGARER